MIFFILATVYGFLCSRPSSSILFLPNSRSCQISARENISEGGPRTCSDKYQTLDISGTSGSTKKPANATGSEITPSMMKSLVVVSRYPILVV